MGAGRKELVDIKLAGLLTGGFLYLSLRQDAQVFVLREWCMVRTLIQLCQGIRPVSSTGGAGGQCFNHLLHGGSPGLAGVHPYQGYTILSILSGISCADQYVGNIVAGFLNVSPNLKAAYGNQFCRGMARSSR